MADSIDRVFGHALNTVNKIRPGSQKPPSGDRLALYGLYKQSMEGNVADIADRPSVSANSRSGSLATEHVKKEQEKWDAWKGNEGMSRTEAKRRYIEKLIDTMHKYASTTPEARELVEELEFVWDQVKSNSQHSSSERSSPLAHIERSGFLQQGGLESSATHGSSSAAAIGALGRASIDDTGMRILSPVSQEDEAELLDDEREEFVDAPDSQYDEMDRRGDDDNDDQSPRRRDRPGPGDARWKRKIEYSLVRLATEVAALREQLENRRYFKIRSQKGIFGWFLKLSWWAVQLVVADAVLLFLVILYMRRKQDRRLEGAVRVLLGDAVAQVQKAAGEVKMPTLPKLPGSRKQG